MGRPGGESVWCEGLSLSLAAQNTGLKEGPSDAGEGGHNLPLLGAPGVGRRPGPGLSMAGWWAGSPAGPCWWAEEPQMPRGQSCVPEQSRRRLVPRTVQAGAGWGSGRRGWRVCRRKLGLP